MADIQPSGTESHEILRGSADAGLVILCDHASNWLPDAYGTLGLDPAQLKRHIAYDIGAAALTRGLSERLRAPAVMSRYSRLLIDPNRGDDDPTLIMRLSDGAVVPGNRHLDDAERQHRIERFWRPYHQAIDHVIEAATATGRPPAILSIHSFTESWKGVPRPWHVGILWERDPRLAVPMLEAFRSEHELIVGENEPYPGSYEGDCCWQHAARRGLPWVVLEIRQDLIRDAAGQAWWVDRIARIVESLSQRPDLNIAGSSKPTPQ